MLFKNISQCTKCNAPAIFILNIRAYRIMILFSSNKKPKSTRLALVGLEHTQRVFSMGHEQQTFTGSTVRTRVDVHSALCCHGEYTGMEQQ